MTSRFTIGLVGVFITLCAASSKERMSEVLRSVAGSKGKASMARRESPASGKASRA